MLESENSRLQAGVLAPQLVDDLVVLTQLLFHAVSFGSDLDQSGLGLLQLIIEGNLPRDSALVASRPRRLLSSVRDVLGLKAVVGTA